MEQPRYTGKLAKWNAERGFGFIKADDGGQDIFVHITSFARQSEPPQAGEALSFEVEPDRNGKRSAVRVRRPGDQQRIPAGERPKRAHRASSDKTPSLFGQLVGTILLLAMAFFAYSQYSKRAAVYDSVLPTAPAAISPSTLPVPADFKCDGRNMCSQMTSCREATLFLQNCPGMKMDGNGDGVPCEQQWCGK